MNPAAILALLSDLYEQIAQLRQSNTELAARLAKAEQAPSPPAT